MFITAILLVTMSTGLTAAVDAQRQTRAPQLHPGQYQQPDGLNVELKFFSPEGRRDNRNLNQRPARQDVAEKPATTQSTIQTFQYKPFEEVPSHIKQLMYDIYGHQEPYVNPHAFFYKNYVGVPDDFLTKGLAEAKNLEEEKRRTFEDSQRYEQSDKYDNRRSFEEHAEPVAASTTAPIAYRTAYTPKHTLAKIQPKIAKAGIKYKDDGKKYATEVYGTRAPPRSHRTLEQTKRSPEAELREEQGDVDEFEHRSAMPESIQTLLHYQSQIPYNVLANQIIFEAKKPFIPKPLPDDVRASASYPSKIYYIRADGQVLEEVPTVKVDGGQMTYKEA